jgi:uncharacterized repeat protein (TIGR03803 family)
MAAALLGAVTAVTGEAVGRGEDVVQLQPGVSPALETDLYAAVSESVPWNFGATAGDGIQPYAGLIADKWGNLYGTTLYGGTITTTGGTVFELTPSAAPSTQWSERVLWSFGASDDGRQPYGTLINDALGNFYGTTSAGGENGFGTVFQLSVH